MGIDAQAYSKLFPKVLRERPGGRRALATVEDQARRWSAEQGLETFFQSRFISDVELEVYIHPIADPLIFQATAHGIGVEFRSSNGGPGFHAAAVELLDYIGQQTEISWHWGELASCGDDTGYALSKDLTDLQWQLAEFLQSLMELVSKHTDGGGSVCIPWGLGGDDEGLCGPLGIQPASWPSDIIDATETERLEFAASFYPWWEQGKGAQFWEGLLRGMLWQLVNWRAPIDDQETQVLEMVHEAARNLETVRGSLPADLTRTLEELDQAVRNGIRPSEDGLGYRRRDVTLIPFANWQIKVPGYFVEFDDDDDDTACFTDGDLNLFISAFSMQNTNDAPFEEVDWLQGAVQIDEHGLSRRVGKPKISRDDDCVTQQAMVVHIGNSCTRSLTLTLAADDAKGLRDFDRWLASIRYCSDGED